MGRAVLWVKVAAALLIVSPASALDAPSSAREPDARVERYAGEASLGSQPPVPVHLEIGRSGQAVSGVIRAHGAEFTLEDAAGSDTVTAKLGGPGGGPIVLRFAGGRVEGEFKLGAQDGTLQAETTTLDAAAFFAEPPQRLDLSPAEWRADLERLAEILTTRHGAPFHRTAKDDFEREVARIHDSLPGLTGAQAAIEFRKLAALVGDGHTAVAEAEGRPRLPLEAFWFEDGLRVVGIAAEHQDVLGARLTEVDGVPIPQVLARLRPYAPQGESPWSYRFVAPYLLAEPDVLDNAGIGGGPTRSFTVELIDGSSSRITLDETAEPVRRAILGGARPLWRAAPSEDFRIVPLPDGSLYVNWKEYGNLHEHVAMLMAELDKRRPRRLIVDLRDSGGGDFNLGRELIAQIASLPWLNRPDRLFVLTGRRTFSAAMTNAVDFRATTRATLVGEPPGAAPNNWQEVRFHHLPHSGLRVGVSTLYYEFLPGENAVHPDVYIPPTPADWGSEYDSAVRHILALPAADEAAD